MNVSDLVNEFAACVSAQSESIDKGDPNAGNQFAKRYVAAFEQLRAQGNVGRDALAILLDDRRPDVRVMAATFLLRHCGDRAIHVLKNEAGSIGVVSFGASQALQRWHEGTWALYLE